MMKDMRRYIAPTILALLAHELLAQDAQARPVEADPVLQMAKEHFAMEPNLSATAPQNPASTLGHALFWDARLRVDRRGAGALRASSARASWIRGALIGTGARCRIDEGAPSTSIKLPTRTKRKVDGGEGAGRRRC